MTDGKTTVSELKELIGDFCAKRNWKPRVLNTAISVNLEAAELLEIFQWCDQAEAEDAARVTNREHFLEELADVMIYCMQLAIACDVDVASAIESKLQKNAIKYPSDRHEREP